MIGRDTDQENFKTLQQAERQRGKTSKNFDWERDRPGEVQQILIGRETDKEGLPTFDRQRDREANHFYEKYFQPTLSFSI